MRAAAISPGPTPSLARALATVAGRVHSRVVSHALARALALALALAAPPGAAPAQTIDAAPPTAPRVHAFAGVGYTAGEARDGFRLGEVVARVAAPLGARWSFLGEAVAEPRADGLEFSLDRLAVRYPLTDDIVLTAGRFRTAIGYANTAFDRSGWSRPTISSPAMLAPGSGLLPTRSVGLRATGPLHIEPIEPLGLGWSVALSNGRETNITQPEDAGTVAGGVAATLALEARPVALEGARVGASFHRHRPSDRAISDVEERIVAGHVVWDGGAPEVIVEVARVTHERLETDLPNTHARTGYLQLGYRLPAGTGTLTPFFRFDRVSVDERDPFYAGRVVGSRTATIGVRRDLSPAAVVKAEMRAVRGEDDEGWSRVFALGLDIALAPRERPLPLVAAVPEDDVGAHDDSATDDAAAREASATGAPATRASADAPTAVPDRTTRAGSSTAPGGAAHSRSPVRSASAETSPSVRGAIAIVAHPDLDVDDLSLPELRRIFRGDRTFWDGGERVVLLVRTPEADEREIVLPRIYQMEESEFRQFWLNRIFRDAVSTGPKMVADQETALQLVAALPGAISFVPAERVTPELRVVRVDGKLPGEPGYPLQ